MGLVCPEDTKDAAALCTALNGNVPVVPAKLHSSGHGATGPGGVTLFIGQGSLGGVHSGLNAVEHGYQEGAPGAFAPFVGGFDDVKTRLQDQGLVFQFAKGGGHGIDPHGSFTSRFSKI